jgi:hypothetical protein
MKFIDTKIGMKIKRIGEDHKDVKKGSVYTIEKAYCGGVSLKGMGDYWYDLDLFEPVVMKLEQSKDEPVNKFEVGDKVIYRYYHGKICDKVRYCGEDSKGNPIIEYDNGYVTNNVDYSQLSPLKKPDELEVGDKFIAFTDRKLEVLGVHYDDYREEKVYTAKNINDESCCCGEVSIYRAKSVEEIIYD